MGSSRRFVPCAAPISLSESETVSIGECMMKWPPQLIHVPLFTMALIAGLNRRRRTGDWRRRFRCVGFG
jgi:hypothetical protein